METGVAIGPVARTSGPPRSWLRRSSRLAALVEITWSSEIGDPEFKKNLRTSAADLRSHRVVSGARSRTMAPATGVTPLSPRIDELTRRITLPADVPLTLKVLLGRRFAFEQLLVELGDAEYLCARAAELHAESKGSVVTWRTVPGGDAITGGRADGQRRDERRHDEMEGRADPRRQGSSGPVPARPAGAGSSERCTCC